MRLLFIYAGFPQILCWEMEKETPKGGVVGIFTNENHLLQWERSWGANNTMCENNPTKGTYFKIKLLRKLQAT